MCLKNRNRLENRRRIVRWELREEQDHVEEGFPSGSDRQFECGK